MSPTDWVVGLSLLGLGIWVLVDAWRESAPRIRVATAVFGVGAILLGASRFLPDARGGFLSLSFVGTMAMVGGYFAQAWTRRSSRPK